MRLAALIHALALFALTAVAFPNAAPSAIYRRAPTPSLAARSPQPSAALRKRVTQEALVGHEELTQLLCPRPMKACPIQSSTSPTTLSEWLDKGFECVDFREDLTSCGGCGISDAKYDCTAIEGSDAVSCAAGECRVDSCSAGYVRSLDGKSCVRAN